MAHVLWVKDAAIRDRKEGPSRQPKCACVRHAGGVRLDSYRPHEAQRIRPGKMYCTST